MATRYYSQNDRDFMDRVNNELVGDLTSNQDGIINQTIVIYQHSIQETSTNMYGEAAAGKLYKPGVEVASLITADDFDFNTDEFGPDLRQNATFAILRQSLIDADVRPELGDIIDWNLGHWEVSNMNENQLVGGDYNNNWSVVLSAFLVRRSNLQIERVRSN
jgi:hypothetical protein|tara:strand:- start:1558 stop:2043 length:486 start_codon:yes stop_codon:yes gene_type:complete